MNIERVNLGELILEKVIENGLSKAKFAEQVGIARQNVDKTVFKKHGLDTDLLCVISEVLDFNFFQCFVPCNQKDYSEVKATITIEMGAEKQKKTFKFKLGDNEIKVE